MPLDLGPLGPQPPRQRRVAGEVDPLLDADHRGQPELERLLAAAVLPPGPGAGTVPGDLQVLDTGDTGPAQGAGDPDAHLVVTGVARLVAAQHQVVARPAGGAAAPLGHAGRPRGAPPPF